MSDAKDQRIPLEQVAAPGPRSFVDGPFGSEMKSSEYSEGGVRLVQLQNIGDGYWIDDNKKFIPWEKFETLRRHGASPGDIAIAKMADPVARSCVLPAVADQYIVVADCIKLTPDPERFDARFVSAAINNHRTRREAEAKSSGTTRLRINLSALKTVHIWAPQFSEQRQIALILNTVDTAIAQTEAVIAKLKQIRAGLLHDLLTRGLDEHGQLRPPPTEAPDLYQNSPLGKIPRGWEVRRLEKLAASAVDGPSGSNLKTQHYVAEPGVQVVRLQNIDSGRFDNSDRAFISTDHAATLARHSVVPDDLLVASMGDDNHPLARACLYPAWLKPGIVKADRFRLRMNTTLAVNGFVMLFLNCPSTRSGLNLLGQGVTRDRANLTTLLALNIYRPDVKEQERIVEIIAACDIQVSEEECALNKFRYLKSGLMADLLTGRVRVPESLMNELEGQP